MTFLSKTFCFSKNPWIIFCSWSNMIFQKLLYYNNFLFFRKSGPIYSVRLLKGGGGLNKGFGYIMYRNLNAVDTVIQNYNGTLLTESNRSKPLIVQKSLRNTIMMIYGLSPKNNNKCFIKSVGILFNKNPIMVAQKTNIAFCFRALTTLWLIIHHFCWNMNAKMILSYFCPLNH